MFTQRGNTLIELLVGVLLVSVVASAAVSSFSRSIVDSRDNKIITRAEEKARTVLELIAYDLRNIGSGIPLGQEDFDQLDNTLGDAPLAVLLSSTSESIVMRANQRGRVSVLTADYTPSLMALAISLDNTENLNVGDIVYLSNMPKGKEDGLRAEINNVALSSINIDSSYLSAAGAVFEAGSILSRVSEVTYTSDALSNSIYREDEYGEVTVASNTSFNLQYLDSSGTALSLPMSAANVKEDLTSIEITVTVNGERNLSNGTAYTAQATQLVALRNLNLGRGDDSNFARDHGGLFSSSSSSSSVASSSSSVSSSSSSSAPVCTRWHPNGSCTRWE